MMSLFISMTVRGVPPSGFGYILLLNSRIEQPSADQKYKVTSSAG